MEVGEAPELNTVEGLFRETSREHVAVDARLSLRRVDVAWKLEAVRTTIPQFDDPAREREEEHPKSGGGGWRMANKKETSSCACLDDPLTPRAK